MVNKILILVMLISSILIGLIVPASADVVVKADASVVAWDGGSGSAYAKAFASNRYLHTDVSANSRGNAIVKTCAIAWNGGPMPKCTGIVP